jgi:preprotein translocase subunit SecG
MELKLRNFLKTYNDIVLGIFSFLVWGLITLLQTGRIKINEDLSIPPAKLLILLIFDIILLVVAAVISRHQWTDSSKAIPLTKIKLMSISKEKIADTVMIIITLFFFILPLFLTSPIKTKDHYIVAIPYEDYSISEHLGSTRWGSRLLCEIIELDSIDRYEAKELAVKMFLNTSNASMLFPKKEKITSVTLKKQYILAERRE